MTQPLPTHLQNVQVRADYLIGHEHELAKCEIEAELKGSLLLFTCYFFKQVTGKDFLVSQPMGRESHHITICRELTNLFWNQKPAYGLLINVPPGYGKSTLLSMFVAWCYAHYPDCNFLYISYSHELAAKHTSFVRLIMTCKMYEYFFETRIRTDSRAKDKLITTAGGITGAHGSGGSITGMDAGLPNQSRFTGCAIIDDPIKPDAGHSETIRETVISNYTETILQRPRDIKVPLVFLGQRIHEQDLAAHLLSGEDVRTWKPVILPGIDEAGNALYPEIQPLEYLEELQQKQPYVFSSQIQQKPIPAGGALYKPDYFPILDEEPTILTSFITVDTAETSKNHNDASVFSFFGIYEIENFGVKTGDYALHWIDCVELRVEPKDLQGEFLEFFADCMRHRVPPRVVAIEAKSTGVTLASTMSDLRGVTVRKIQRSAASGSKTDRFLNLQPILASKLVSLPKFGKHTQMCIDHMIKITASNTHRFDDICDTVYDACQLALIEKTIYNVKNDTRSKVTQNVLNSFKQRQGAINRAKSSQTSFRQT